MDRDQDRELPGGAMRLPASRGAAPIEGLDEQGDAEPDAEAAWASEVGRRLREVESGAVEAVPWAVARRRIADEGLPSA